MIYEIKYVFHVRNSFPHQIPKRFILYSSIIQPNDLCWFELHLVPFNFMSHEFPHNSICSVVKEARSTEFTKPVKGVQEVKLNIKLFSTNTHTHREKERHTYSTEVDFLFTNFFHIAHSSSAKNGVETKPWWFR